MQLDLHDDANGAARAFWLEHARSNTGLPAVQPAIRLHRYHAWTRDLLKAWTRDRVLADRPRYRRCVDLGCGPGEWSALFAPVCDELHACDVSPDFVAQARARLAWHPGADVRVADARGFELPEGVDLVYLGAMLLHLPDRDVRDLLRRVRMATQPGAHVLIRDWCAFNAGRRRVNTGTGFSIHRRPGELLALAEAAGLRCIELRSSPSIYGEHMARGLPGLQWPLRGLWRLVSLPWTRASHTLRFRA